MVDQRHSEHAMELLDFLLMDEDLAVEYYPQDSIEHLKRSCVESLWQLINKDLGACKRLSPREARLLDGAYDFTEVRIPTGGTMARSAYLSRYRKVQTKSGAWLPLSWLTTAESLARSRPPVFFYGTALKAMLR